MFFGLVFVFLMIIACKFLRINYWDIQNSPKSKQCTAYWNAFLNKFKLTIERYKCPELHTTFDVCKRVLQFATNRFAKKYSKMCANPKIRSKIECRGYHVIDKYLVLKENSNLFDQTGWEPTESIWKWRQDYAAEFDYDWATAQEAHLRMRLNIRYEKES